MVRRRRRSTLFPYTTLFRSVEPQREQGVDRKRRVPYPGVAVVPVALAADLLGQAGRRCRDEAAGGGVGQELERDRRSVHHLPPAPGVGGAREPGLPERDRVVEQFSDLAHRHVSWPSLATGLQDDAAHLSGLELDREADVALLDAAVREPCIIRLADRVQGEGQDRKSVV